VERVPRRGPTPHRGSRHERNVDLGAGRERSCVTVMTLMTLIYGLILDEGMRLYFVGSPTCQRLSALPNTSSKASNSVGEDSALRLLASFARKEKARFTASNDSPEASPATRANSPS
jgi:hypothetical protein